MLILIVYASKNKKVQNCTKEIKENMIKQSK